MTAPEVEAVSALTRPGMGTENAGPLLRSLVTMIRPRSVIEVGAGSSTLHLLLGLRDAKTEFGHDRQIIGGDLVAEERASVLHPWSAAQDYAPRLIVVDDISVPGTSADLVRSAAVALGLDELLRFIERDFFALSDDEIKDWGPLDLVWLDAGTQVDDARFIAALWPLLAPGGLLVLHEPYLATTVEASDGNGHSRTMGKIVASPLLQELRRQVGQSSPGFELLALTESHKFRQAGILLVRKHAGWERDRGTSFGVELKALGETEDVRPPVLSPTVSPPFGGLAGQSSERPSVVASPSEGPATAGLLAALADDVRRKVYSAVVLGSGTAQEISKRVGIASTRCARALVVLEQAALVENSGTNWSATTEVWRGAAPRRAQAPAPMTIPAKQGKRRVFLEGLVPRFAMGQRYPEREVNQMLGEVNSDFAALRRYLVEEGLLQRADGYYWRP